MSVFSVSTSVSHQVWSVCDEALNRWYNSTFQLDSFYYDTPGLQIKKTWLQAWWSCTKLLTELWICVHSNLLWTLIHNEKHPQYNTTRWSRNTIYNITNWGRAASESSSGIHSSFKPWQTFSLLQTPPSVLDSLLQKLACSLIPLLFYYRAACK